MDPKGSPGRCDFVYLRGPKRGRKCLKEGWKDGTQHRCTKHRLAIIKCWHRTRRLGTLHVRYQELLEELKEKDSLIKKLASLVREAPDQDSS